MKMSDLTPLSKGNNVCLLPVIHDPVQDVYECWYNKHLKVIYEPHELPPAIREVLCFIRAIPFPKTSEDALAAQTTASFSIYINKHSPKLQDIGWKYGKLGERIAYCVVIPDDLVTDMLRQYGGTIKSV